MSLLGGASGFAVADREQPAAISPTAPAALPRNKRLSIMLLN